MSTELEFWKECLSDGASQCGLELTPSQLETLASNAQGGHENYGMAFYTPPSSDRYNELEREYKAKHTALQAQLDTYRNNAERAVKEALRQPSDANVSIGEYGEVFLHGGRTIQIQ